MEIHHGQVVRCLPLSRQVRLLVKLECLCQILRNTCTGEVQIAQIECRGGRARLMRQLEQLERFALF